ncbi:MAG: fructosamine kinase family protein [Ignavibacteria bacterium]|jgi:fructosamine-3-kinase
MLDKLLKNKIEQEINDQISNVRSVSGGCISNAYMLKLSKGNDLFLKVNSSGNTDMFIKEAHGLQELKKADAIKIPDVISFNSNYILLEFIHSIQRQNNFSEDFGRKFALMHEYNNQYFGFYENNFIGSNPQINIAEENEKENWTEFYFNKRIVYQLKLAEQYGNSTSDLQSAIKKLETKIESIISDETEKPALLHGDLWGGNYVVDDEGFACLIDPAVYYGNREADLAMTKLFGGFDSKFYNAYNEANPLSEGYEYRENIYKLYHVMNHLNLFGSGYYGQCMNLIDYYL